MKYIKSFQGLRAYAILLIFTSHCNYIVGSNGRNVFDYAGALGVSLFIMLSGFLAVNKGITSCYLPMRINRDQLIESVRRKLNRFYPLHFVMLIFSLPFLYKILSTTNWWKYAGVFFLNVLLLQTWLPISGVYFSFNAVSWYLSLTLFFIIVTPFIVNVLYNKSDKYIGGLIAFLLGFELLIALTLGDSRYIHWIAYICPLMRLSDFVIGGG